ncbi:hypothetical protein BVRB_3g050580 [Beta vulgaris subsp. vulgaris]|uniref:Uncharacterized protein n=1 Tax=Beta vulgaris subsp. vulgaris TaxID=3555 RepID=A0A0J8CWU5_BETVV|nr:hypothetical protein BVRB_3g050580 [Beta vulgaris subsp. vulgaris]
MEAAFAGALSSTISSMLSFHISQKLTQMGVSEAELQLMKEKFRSIQLFVDNVPNTEWGTGSHLVKRLLQKVNGLTFLVENTIDKYDTEILRRKNCSFKKTSILPLSFRTSRNVANIFSLLNEFQKEASKMERVAQVASPRFNRYNSVTSDRVPDPMISNFVGRNGDVEKIVSTLSNGNMGTGSDKFIIAIVGVAGIGKTTLASRVYQTDIIQEKFSKMFWIKVGEDFDAARILKEMLQSLDEEIQNLSDFEAIMSKLLNLIKGEQTLIVLDDCSMNQEQLNLLHPLQSGGDKISILVTTRRAEAARTMGASYIHTLEGLSEEDTRSLFKSVAFHARPIEEDRKLEMIEKMIVDRHDVLIIDGQTNHQSNLSDVRHLVISSGNIEEAPQVKIAPIEQLRTINSIVAAVPESLLSQAKSLYVLKLDNIDLKEVPKNLGKLKFLRYLDLSNNPIKYLPESITHLYLLQTLLLINCKDLLKLPEGLANLINLSNLEVPPQFPKQMVPTTALRIQPHIRLDEEGGSVKISELGNLNDIAGPLCISGLEYVKDKEAAQKARIGRKHGLSALELCWNREILEASECQDEDVLDGLQPHPNIRRLRLINYEGQKFPMWVMRMKGEVNERRLYRLQKIELVDCKRCQQIPTMGQLPCLQELIIAEWLPAPRSETEDDGDCQAFPRLEILQVVNCPNLSSIPTNFPRMKSLLIQGIKRSGNWLETIITSSCGWNKSSLTSPGEKNSTLTSIVLCMVSELKRLPNELFHCTSLEKLSLQNCQNFNTWPANPWKLISLKELCIDDCPCLTSSPHLEGLTSLNTLVIRGCPRLPEAPRSLGQCTSLIKLSISNCTNISTVPDFQRLTSLEELDIIDCVKIRTLPPGLHILPNLRTMRVGRVCDRFDRFPQCNSLERLWLKGMPDMNSLPETLKLLIQLKVLRIRSFGSLEVVPDWICELKNLQILIFEECGMLKQFPSQRKMLQLKKLRCLRIEKCAIYEQTLLENGIERKKVGHVPHIKIKGIWFQGYRSSSLQEMAAKKLDDEVMDDEYLDAYGYEGDIPHAEDDGSRRRILLSFLVFYVLSMVIISLYWTILYK